MKTIRLWTKNARAVALYQSVLPAIAAVFLSTAQKRFSFLFSYLAIIGVLLAHLSLNLFDDWFDYRRQNFPRAGKCEYLKSGQATTGQLLMVALMLGGIAGICGAVILFYRGLSVFWIALAAAILGIFYSAPPLRLSYHGMGELTVGIVFGPLLAAGVSIACSGAIRPGVVLQGIMTGLLTCNILYTHSIMDEGSDRAAGKITLSAILKSKNSKLTCSVMFGFVPYLLTIFGILTGRLPIFYFLVFLCLPWSIELSCSLAAWLNDPSSPVKNSKWYGPMSIRANTISAELDRFLFRWLLARNIVGLFSLLCIAASICNVNR